MKNSEKPPVLYRSEAECCGCAACANICPVGAISMTADAKGFQYPKIQPEVCIRCYQCQRVCPLKEAQA